MSAPGTDDRAVEDCVQAIMQIEDAGLDRAALARIAGLLARLATRRDLFSFERYPLPEDPKAESRAHPMRIGPDGRLPLIVISQRVVPGTPPRPAHLPHQHPTWGAAACVHGTSFDTLWRRTQGAAHDDALEPVEELRLGPGEGFAMMPQDIHSVRADPDRPSLHLLVYGREFGEAVAFDPATGVSHIHRVAAIGAKA